MPLQETCLCASTPPATIIKIIPVTSSGFDQWFDSLSTHTKAWIKATGFIATGGTAALIAGADGAPAQVYVGVGADMPKDNNPWWLAAVVEQLPAGDFLFDNTVPTPLQHAAALGWCMAHYAFNRYKSEPVVKQRTLYLADGAAVKNLLQMAEAMALVRDLVNTPAEDMGPSDLQDIAEAMAEAHGATICTIVGDDLLDENFPAIHAVGRAAALGREPRLIDMRWGNVDAPRITLVGKGVCFDTGGLDIKPGAGMRLMKKDMGGAAHALGLAQLIMTAGLNVNLRMLIPAVENAIAGNAYRPSDVVTTRKGLSVEIGNTDAEGRVILCDALAFACEEKPDLLIDFATLTGAARTALGADLPATYSNTDSIWQHLDAAATATGDPLWRMPLWAPYDEDLASPVADLCNITATGLAGSITAALYLQRFVDNDIKWVHYDVFAWSPKNRPGRPLGGDAQGLRATFVALQDFLNG